jgi:hypothetical protein
MFEKCVARVKDVLGVLLSGAALLAPLSLHAQPYPNNPTGSARFRPSYRPPDRSQS